MDLLKADDCLLNDVIIPKFEAYGFHKISLNLFQSYFSNWKQNVKIGSAISAWIYILTGIPKSFILGPLIFSIFINNLIMFIEISDICNFAANNALWDFMRW